MVSTKGKHTMRRRVLIQILASMGICIAFMILTSPQALADNCGSLSDCFGVSGAAASVTAGVAVIITIAVLALPSLLDSTKSTHIPPGPPSPEHQPTDLGPQHLQRTGEHHPVSAPNWPPIPPIPPVVPVPPPAEKRSREPHSEKPTLHPLGRQPVPPSEEPKVPSTEHPSAPQPQGSPLHPPGHPPRPPSGEPQVLPQERPTLPHPEPTLRPPGHPPAPPAGVPQAPSIEHPTAPLPQGSALHPTGHPPAPPSGVPQAPSHAHPTEPPQSQALRPSQPSQITRSNEQIEIARPRDSVELPPDPVEPPVRSLLHGIHHVTAIAGNPQQNIDFYAGLLGLRLVKLTVNINNPNTYHIYYGDELGRPGTVLSFFTWPGAPSTSSRGSGQAVAVAFSVPEGTLNQWAEHLSRRGIRITQPTTRFDVQMFSFYDPDGLQINMVAHRDTGMYPARSSGPIPPEYAIRGIYGITLLEDDYEHTHAFLTEVLGFHQIQAGVNYFRYEVGNGGPGTFLDVQSFPGLPPGQPTLGTIHHSAWSTPEDEQQAVLRQQLMKLGFNVTEGADPLYFPSYSFREPGGGLFEIAKLVPGFTVDEPPEQLGTHLMLPSWLAPRHAELQRVLPPLRLPFASGST
jgi:glyoxalase family protein